MYKRFYTNIIFKYPVAVLLFVLLGVSILGYYATKLEIDASSESLLLENDKDLKYTREIYKRYPGSNFLVISFSPNSDLLSKQSLDTIESLSNDLLQLRNVKSITSILNVPLFQTSATSLSELADGIDTLKSENIDKRLVKKEFITSPLYENNLVSRDFKTTAIMINLYDDEKYVSLRNKRDELKEISKKEGLSKDQKKELRQVIKEFKAYRDIQRENEHKNIEKIRQIMDKYRSKGELFLGGVNMIADDMISFVKSDLKIYGTILLAILVVVLWIIFGKKRWILLPIIICILSVIATTGVLGLFNWEVTVVSSNFISLQLIITISLILHLIVRYRELSLKYTKSSQRSLVLNTVLSKIEPSFFAIITTIAGFGSLVVSGIKPVIHLGFMMSTGIALSLLIVFIVFPAIMIMMDKTIPNKSNERKFSLTRFCSNIVIKYKKYIIIVSIATLFFSISGSSRLIVENSFIDYFKKSTEIYQGMKVIDESLGGTTPLDVIVDFKAQEAPKVEVTQESDDEFDSFEAEFEEEKSEAQYWFTQQRIKKILQIHDYLESIPEIGKVQSLATMLKVGKELNEGKDLDSFQLALLYNKLPQEYKKLILDPYVSIENDQVRFTMRIVDSNEELRRNNLLIKIKTDLQEIVKSDIGESHLSSLMVLYNNMLQSLFKSQILTIGIVALILLFMFFILFRSLLMSLIALVVNIIPISMVFGIMGWFNIPLDMMTITIAAISIGMGVDDTIHYIHRYTVEFKKDKDYVAAMRRSHESIGYAMYYTTLSVMIGFSILIFSNFIPTIYFGLLTVLVMFLLLVSALLLLPRLLIILKPFGTNIK